MRQLQPDTVVDKFVDLVMQLNLWLFDTDTLLAMWHLVTPRGSIQV
jgi:hypothetical protein